MSRWEPWKALGIKKETFEFGESLLIVVGCAFAAWCFW